MAWQGVTKGGGGDGWGGLNIHKGSRKQMNHWNAAKVFNFHTLLNPE